MNDQRNDYERGYDAGYAYAYGLNYRKSFRAAQREIRSSWIVVALYSAPDIEEEPVELKPNKEYKAGFYDGYQLGEERGLQEGRQVCLDESIVYLESAE